MRARMALYYAGIQCEIREVDLKDKPQALRDVSAKATVPVLLLADGRVMDESLDIMRWALSRHDPEQWLSPSAGNLNDMNTLIHHYDSAFKYHLDRYKYPQRYGSHHAETHFRQACDMLAGLEQRLTRSACLFGDTASLADVALFPFVRQFAAVDRCAFDALPLLHVRRWLSGWLADERFLAVMVKRNIWHAGAEITLLLP